MIDDRLRYLRHSGLPDVSHARSGVVRVLSIQHDERHCGDDERCAVMTSTATYVTDDVFPRDAQ
jgi:hypothetical protein